MLRERAIQERNVFTVVNERRIGEVVGQEVVDMERPLFTRCEQRECAGVTVTMVTKLASLNKQGQVRESRHGDESPWGYMVDTSRMSTPEILLVASRACGKLRII